MDNAFSQAQLSLPPVPENFEAMAGSSKSDLVRAILNLLASAQITGINTDEPSSIDLGQLQNQIQSLQTQVTNNAVTIIQVPMSGVPAGLVTVAFDSVQTNVYSVDVAFITTGTTTAPAWSLISGSQQQNQCQIFIGGSSTWSIVVTITTLPIA